MERGSSRTLAEGERRDMAARMLAAVPGGARPGGIPLEPARRRRGEGGKAASGREAARRGRRTGVQAARRLERLLLDLPGKMGFPTAFCAAVAAWGLAVALALGSLGVVGR